MFCVNCGAKIADGAKFCNNCGSPVSDVANEESIDTTKEDNSAPGAVKKNTLEDKIFDKLTGLDTTRVSMEDMISLLKTAFLCTASEAELKKIEKAAGGGLFGHGGIESADGRYKIITYNAMSVGGKMDILHPGDSSWFILDDYKEGKRYQFNAFTLGKFKKAVKEAIKEARK